MHSHGSRQTLVALRHYIDLCTTTVGSNGSTSIVLRLKGKSNSRCKLAVRKIDEHRELFIGSLKKKVYLPLHPLVIIEKRE